MRLRPKISFIPRHCDMTLVASGRIFVTRVVAALPGACAAVTASATSSASSSASSSQPDGSDTLVGGGTINRWLHDHGFDSTRANSRVPGREGARAAYGWGQTTPREMAALLVMIRADRRSRPTPRRTASSRLRSRNGAAAGSYCSPYSTVVTTRTFFTTWLSSVIP